MYLNWLVVWKMFDVSICWEFQHPSDSYFSDGVGSTTNQLKYEMIPTCCSLGGEPPLNHASSRLIFAHPPAELLQESPSFVIGSKATWMNWRIWMDLVVGQHWCNWCMHPGMHRFFALVFYPPLWQCRLLWHQIPCKTEKTWVSFQDSSSGCIAITLSGIFETTMFIHVYSDSSKTSEHTMFLIV